MKVRELPDADLRYSTGFPIHRQPPPELRSSMGLTLPPRVGVLVPKTHTFSCNLYRLAWLSLMAWRVKMAQFYQELARFGALPVAVPRCAGNSTLGRLLNSLAFISRHNLIWREASAASAKLSNPHVTAEWVRPVSLLNAAIILNLSGALTSLLSPQVAVLVFDRVPHRSRHPPRPL